MQLNTWFHAVLKIRSTSLNEILSSQFLFIVSILGLVLVGSRKRLEITFLSPKKVSVRLKWPVKGGIDGTVVIQALRQIAEQGGMVLLSTHSRDVSAGADQVYTFKQKRQVKLRP